MSLIVVLFFCLKSYSQNSPSIDIKIIDKDTLFVFNKPYAAYIIKKLDSLNHFKSSYFDCFEVLDNSVGVINSYKEVINTKDKLILNLNKQVFHCDELAESYDKSEKINKKLQEDLQKQYRKTKTWNTVSWIAISTTILTSIIILIK